MLDEAGIKSLLPTPKNQQQETTAAPVVTSAPQTNPPGTFISSNPPAQDANDQLLFDPDEFITYDYLSPGVNAATPQQLDTLPPVDSTSKTPDIVVDTRTTDPPSSGVGSSGMTWWVIAIVGFIVLSLIFFLYIRSKGGSSPAPSTNAPRSSSLFGSSMPQPGTSQMGSGSFRF